MRFWDSSAVVRLLVEQDESRAADLWLEQDDQMAIWTLTHVEVVSALRRLVRDGELDEEVAREADVRSEELSAASHVIIDVESVKTRGCRLLRIHGLRAADALQLGAALAWAQDRPNGRTLHTFDGRLARAARREGFQVLP